MVLKEDIDVDEAFRICTDDEGPNNRLAIITGKKNEQTVEKIRLKLKNKKMYQIGFIEDQWLNVYHKSGKLELDQSYN